MRTDLGHLPPAKRAELAFATEVLQEELAKSLATRQSPDLASGSILKIILFGSYARGDWVEDPVGRYFSDFDLLVVVSDERLTDAWEFWEGAEKRLPRPASKTVGRFMVLRDERGEARPTRAVITAARATLTVIFKLKDNAVFTGLVSASARISLLERLAALRAE